MTIDRRFVDLEEGDTILTDARVELAFVEEMCPSSPTGPTCMAVGAYTTLRITLNGCLDRLGPFYYKVIIDQNYNTKLIVGAVNITNKKSFAMLCLPGSRTIIKKVFVGTSGPVTLEQIKMTNNEG